MTTPEINRKYRRTKKGLLGNMYSNQRRRSRKWGYLMPDYTLKQFRAWAMAQDVFHKLFDAWVESGYKTMIIPSCDRLNDYEGYSLKRLRFVTWQVNKDKGHSDIKNGINNKQSKEVIQLTENGDFIARHHSTAQAGRATGVSQGDISRCCLGQLKKAGGFRWLHSMRFRL